MWAKRTLDWKPKYMLYIRCMIRTQIYLPKELYQEVAFRAKRENKPKASVIRDALSRGFGKKREQTVGEALIALARLGKKLKASGPTDLSTNHDKYLYEDI